MERYITIHLYELEITKWYTQEWRVDIGRCRVKYYSDTRITSTEAHRIVAEAIKDMRYPSWLRVTTPELHYQKED